MQERAREEESKISIDYLRQLHDRHEELLCNPEKPLNLPVITIDANKDFDEIQEEFQRSFTEIKAQFNREKQKPWRHAIIKV